MYDYSKLNTGRLNEYQTDILKNKPVNNNKYIVLAFRAQQLSNVLHMKTFDQYMQMPDTLESLTAEEDEEDTWSDEASLYYINNEVARKHYLFYSLAVYKQYADADELETLEQLRQAMALHTNKSDGLYGRCYARLFAEGNTEEACNSLCVATYYKKSE